MMSSLRRVVIIVALLNLAYFGVEFGVAMVIGSVSLLADSVDFLEDTSINLVIAVALGWSATNRARLGMALGVILLIPGLSTVWTAWQKFLLPVPPRKRSRRNSRCSRGTAASRAMAETAVQLCPSFSHLPFAHVSSPL